MPEITFRKAPIILGDQRPPPLMLAAAPNAVRLTFAKDGQFCDVVLSSDEATGLGVNAIIGSHAARQLAEQSIAPPMVLKHGGQS